MKKLITAAMAIIIAFTSCEKETIKKDTIVGNGPVETELRSVTGFTKVEVQGKTDITVVYGAGFKVEAKAYRNLLSVLETKVTGDVLKIGYKNGNSVSNDNSEVFITMPLLTKLSTTGNSHIKILSGSAGDFEARITGSGKIEGFGFTAKHATIIIEGSGSAAFTVTDRLHAKITGSGVVYYKGNPSVTSQIAGSGRVEKQ